jgi:aminoglycoside phosphotransferase (APT) family kinase protein
VIVDGSDAVPDPYFAYDYIEGSSFKALAKTLDDESIGHAAEAAGRAIARIGQVTAPDSTRPFRANPYLDANDADDVPLFLAACAESTIFAKRTGAATIAALTRAIDAWRQQLLALTSTRSLVHGDCSRSNVLVRPSHEG